MSVQHRMASSSSSLSRLRGPSHGKLATGDAATLGMMVYYNWREKELAKNDPEGHARLQRLKALFRGSDTDDAHGKKSRRTSLPPQHCGQDRHKKADIGISH